MRDQLHLIDISVAPTFQDLLARAESCAAVGVDIPIGLSDDEYWREADLIARKRLGTRRNAVFAAPVRAVLGARSHEEASDRSQAVTGKRISIQLFNILEKIEQANTIMRPELQKRVVEVHPEVSFCALNDMQPLADKKKSPLGAQQRERLLASVFEDDLACRAIRAGVWLDDFFDACAAAWTARRVALGEAERLPADPPTDRRGLRMEIVY